ncbi:TIGR04282 family arsenosugar biosynthesis glycosyltransferase [Parvibaculaceae bacterium PLY_AMNH_Bact1]|nr:TIGR04282 family arsenosugar biosynthesis glycosyltransferase [Parvibaculaceae bacterium PLY_AMNH_Bact1]
MSKAPRMGNVKTRLAKDIGAAEALRFYKTNTVELLRNVGSDPRWATVIAAAPDVSAPETGFWPDEMPRVPQGEGDLGARMDGVMQIMPLGPVVLIGCDIPNVTDTRIAAAFKALGNHDAVFGPAEDGGYWLVGLKRFPRVRSIFGNVRWSTEHALADTRANLKGARVALLDTLPDIDTGADYERWKATHGS